MIPLSVINSSKFLTNVIWFGYGSKTWRGRKFPIFRSNFFSITFNFECEDRFGLADKLLFLIVIINCSCVVTYLFWINPNFIWVSFFLFFYSFPAFRVAWKTENLNENSDAFWFSTPMVLDFICIFFHDLLIRIKKMVFLFCLMWSLLYIKCCMVCDTFEFSLMVFV